MDRAFGRLRRLTAFLGGLVAGGAGASSGRARALARGPIALLTLAVGALLLGACAPDAPQGGAAEVDAVPGAAEVDAVPGAAEVDAVGGAAEVDAPGGAAEVDAPGGTPRAPGHVAAAAGAPYVSADLARGEMLSYACRACHGLGAGEESPIGPSLSGVFGRRAASVAGFEYSPVLRASEIVWTPEALDAWLAQPADFLPGNNMAFTGFRSADDRRDLIAYLLAQTSPGSGP